MQCPKCKTETLVEFTVDKTAVDRCSLCNGTWFDDHELSQLLAEEATHVARLLKGVTVEEAAGRKGNCPRDGSLLLRIYSAIDHAVIVDACADCHGIWLDGGEFEKLFAAQNHR
jgi:Zn-finger nucleic acid-binding protein